MSASGRGDFDPVHRYTLQMLATLDELEELKTDKAHLKKAMRLTDTLLLEMDAIKVITDDKDILQQLNHVHAGCQEIQEKGLKNSKTFNHALKKIRTACTNISNY